MTTPTDHEAPPPYAYGEARLMEDGGRRESDGDLLARMGADGTLWAAEFHKRFGGDEGSLTGWFANAIEAGRSAALAKARPPAADGEGR